MKSSQFKLKRTKDNNDNDNLINFQKESKRESRKKKVKMTSSTPIWADHDQLCVEFGFLNDNLTD